MPLPRTKALNTQKKALYNSSKSDLNWSPYPDFTDIAIGPTKTKFAKELADEIRDAEYRKHGGFQSMAPECKPMRMAILDACELIENCGIFLEKKILAHKGYNYKPYQNYLHYLNLPAQDLTIFQPYLCPETTKNILNELERESDYFKSLSNSMSAVPSDDEIPVGPLEMDLWITLCIKIQNHIAQYSSQEMSHQFFMQTNSKIKKQNRFSRWWSVFRDKYFIKKCDITSMAHKLINEKRRTYETQVKTKALGS
jgi:hypothetical protein